MGECGELCLTAWILVLLTDTRATEVATHGCLIDWKSSRSSRVCRTNASVKSYQLVKVVSGGRAPGKSSSLASPQLLVIEQFHCFGAVRLEKVQFVYCID